MKTAVLSILAPLIFGLTHAQVQFGFKAGFNFADIRGDFANGYGPRTGFHAGAFLELPVTRKFSLKPELVYSLQGADVHIQDLVDGNLDLNYINVPILAKYNIVHGFFAETGPQIGFLTSSKFKDASSELTEEAAVRKTDFSWAFGLGYELPLGIGVNARYNLGINKVAPEGNADQKNSVYQVGVFYKLGRRK